MSHFDKKVSFDIHNRFDVEVIDASTGEVKQKAQATNIICNNLWSLFFGRNEFGSQTHFGSGTGTPSVSDTQLFTQIGYKSNVRMNGYYPDRNYYYNDLKNKVACYEGLITLGTSEYNGNTITEVGLGNGSSIATHAMLQDMNGNPISIAKTSTDIINIYSKLYVHYDVSNGVFLVSRVARGSDNYGYGWTAILGSLFGIASLDIHTDYQNPCYFINGTQMSSGGAFRWYIDSANKIMRSSVFRVDVDVANIRGISHIETRCNSYRNASGITDADEFVITLPSWNPFNITNESVGTGDGSTTQFKTKFDFPYNATVYINGTAMTSGVTVKKYPCVALTGENQHTTHAMIRLDDGSTDACNIPRFGGQRYGYFRNLLSDSNDGPTTWRGKYSDDFVNWTDINGNTDAISKKAKYFYCPSNDYYNQMASYDGYNIVFDTPPANGDVITIDYTTDYIPKDTDHVLDIQLTLQFGEYTPTP